MCRASEIGRSEEHTSELQSHSHLVCRLLLEKKRASDRKSTRLNSSHTLISHAVFCLKIGNLPEAERRLSEALAVGTTTDLGLRGWRGVLRVHLLRIRRPPKSTHSPYTTLFRS